MIKRIVKMTFRPDATEEFLRLFRAAAPEIRRFPGCARLELLQAPDQEGVYFTLSFWTTSSDLAAYRASDLFRGTWGRTKALFAARPQAWTVRTVALL